MKTIIKISLVTLVLAMTLSLFSCATIEGMLFGREDYIVSDITMTQTGITEFEISFDIDCGLDDVQVYLSNSFRHIGDAKAEKVTKTFLGGDNVHFSFTRELLLGEDYYLWLSYGDKQVMHALTTTSMFPTVTVDADGNSIFHYNYTYGTDWGSYCDPKGKAVYYSESPVFDENAVLIEDGLDIMVEHYTLPADLPENVYFFGVSSARNGKITNISCPVRSSSNLLSEVTGVSAKVTNGSIFRLDIEIPESSEISSLVADELQIMVKHSSAEEIYVIDCAYAGGIATVVFDLAQLDAEGIWYDVLICWNGTVVVDVPRIFNGSDIVSSTKGSKNGIDYNITDWESMLKVYFESTPKDSNVIFENYEVTFDTEKEAIVVNAVLKEGVEKAPILALTAGDKNIVASCKGVQNEDGSYTFTLPVDAAVSVSGKWYDVRFFIDKAVYEVYMNSCMTNENYSAQYKVGSKTYQFQNWDGLLKIEFK